MHGGAAIGISEVWRTYGGVVHAVSGISIDINPGEFLTLLGPSGSGKTTTLMMIAGFEHPDSGEITIGGENVTRLPPHRRNIGMVFQSYALFPHLNVFDNIAYPLRVRKFPFREIARKVKAALASVRLEEFGSRFPNELSGGQQQRIALARALVFEPPLLLMDEPLGALDKRMREHMQLEIKALHESLGITMVYVTHDQTEALVMSDRIAVMQQGRIEQVGSPFEVYERPDSRFVAEFIGESNLIPATVNGNGASAMTSGGSEIAAIGLERFAPNESISLVIRPEKIALGVESASTRNNLRGRVTDIIFYGNTRRYRVRDDDDEFELMVNAPNSRLVETFDRGDKVFVSFDANDCLSVPGGDPAP